MPVSEADPPAQSPARTSQQPSMGMRLRPGKSALSENPIIFGAVQYAPLKIKRLIPPSVVDFIRRALSPRSAPSVPAAPNSEPDRRFVWLHPFFASVELEGEPGAVFSNLRAAGYPVFETPEAAERIAAVVRESGFFDDQHYRIQVPQLGALDPALHYVIVGERMGFAPSSQ